LLARSAGYVYPGENEQQPVKVNSQVSQRQTIGKLKKDELIT
jgi:hypothetical protein